MNYYEIDDYNPLISTFVIPDKFVPIRRFSPEEILSRDAILRFNLIGLNVREIQMFTTPPNKVTGIHIDSHDGEISKGAINFVIGEGTMVWYKLKNQETTRLETSAGTSYMLYDIKNCSAVDKLSLSKLTLVRTNIPHNILNISDRFRYCFSIRFTHNNFEDIFERLQLWNNSFN
jgi:hypothetical protein